MPIKRKKKKKHQNQNQLTSNVQSSKERISVLETSIYYFLEHVFIIKNDEGYRLIVIHQKKLLTDKTYKTAKGAKIAFLKFWRYKAWDEGAKAKWTHFYKPDKNWIAEKLDSLHKVY
jgi:hypothetical protein